VQNLAIALQFLDHAGDILDWNLRVDPVLVEEIDAIGAKALKHPLNHTFDVIRPAIKPGAPLAGFLIDVPAELGCNHNLVAERRRAFAKNPFHLVRTIRLGCVEKRDATVEGGSNDAYHFAARGDRRLIGAAHILHPEADAGDFE
jgi:hypothetical protein